MTRQLLGIPFDTWQVFSAKNTTHYGIVARLLTSGWVISFFATIRSRFGGFHGDLRQFETSLRRFGDIWYDSSRIAMNSDRFAMNSGSFEAWTTIAWRFELIGGENSGFRDHCGSICVDWSRFGWVSDEFGDNKENTIHYGVAFFTKSNVLGTKSDRKKVWRRIWTALWQLWWHLRHLLDFGHNHIRPL